MQCDSTSPAARMGPLHCSVHILRPGLHPVRTPPDVVLLAAQSSNIHKKGSPARHEEGSGHSRVEVAARDPRGRIDQNCQEQTIAESSSGQTGAHGVGIATAAEEGEQEDAEELGKHTADGNGLLPSIRIIVSVTFQNCHTSRPAQLVPACPRAACAQASIIRLPAPDLDSLLHPEHPCRCPTRPLQIFGCGSSWHCLAKHQVAAAGTPSASLTVSPVRFLSYTCGPAQTHARTRLPSRRSVWSAAGPGAVPCWPTLASRGCTGRLRSGHRGDVLML